MKKVSIILIFAFIVNLVYSQHNQPEYTSFESVGTTDMVNLITGDFTYNMPLLHVPGPAKGFDLPLSYHAGIALDQEATWVGLGWSLNSGAIGRTVNRFPDDYSGEKIQTSVENDEMTIGISRSWIVFSDMWNIEEGYGYNLNMGGWNVEWGINNKVSSSGMSFNFDTWEREVDGEQLALSIVSAAAKLVDLGIVSGVLSEVIGILSDFASVYSTASSIANLSSMFSSQTSQLDAFWQNNSDPQWINDDCLVKVESKNFIHSNVEETTYGTLYLKNTPTGRDDGVLPDVKDKYGNEIFAGKLYMSERNVSDYYMHVDEIDYRYSMNPVNLAYDNYRVMGEGISGSISPYRLDVGCLATSTFGQYVLQYNFAPFQEYKVQFKYKGNFVNKYYHQIGEESGLPITNYFNQMGITTAISGGIPHYTIKDMTLLSSNRRIEAERYGLKDKRIIEENYIEWYTNGNIKGGTAFINGNFKDFLETSNRSTFRDECAMVNPDETTKRWNGIGGFSVTRKDGVTFHYALPVYNLLTQIYTISGLDRAEPTETFSENKNKFALSWLLTAITGPDYVDRNNNDVVDYGDWGYWVKFEYRKGEVSYNRTPHSAYAST